VIELDGRIHLAKKESDRERTKEIEDLGLCIIRFRNEEVEKDIDNVVLKITKKVQNILNSGE
jgi:very-short-patch-repair endonuclease